jgi:hypothetical protein
MDAPRFDAMARAWVSVPRRRVLGGLVVGALSTLLGHGARDASATLLLCKRTRNCPKGKVCANKVCATKCSDPFTCSGGGGTGCTNPNCFCGKKPGGGGICADRAACGATLRGCTKQSDCGFLEVCVSGCCGADASKFVCLFACDA